MPFHLMVQQYFLVLSILLAAGSATVQPSPRDPSNSIPPTPADMDSTTVAKIERYAKRLIAEYDRDQNGYLTTQEWSSMRGTPARMDRDHDGQVLLAELVSHIVDYSRGRSLGGGGRTSAFQPNPGVPITSPIHSDSSQSDPGQEDPSAAGSPSSPARPFFVPSDLLPANLPSWFSERDQDGDGQLSIAEYAPHGGRDAVAAFEQLDTNHDGLLTATECTQPP